MVKPPVTAEDAEVTQEDHHRDAETQRGFWIWFLCAFVTLWSISLCLGGSVVKPPDHRGDAEVTQKDHDRDSPARL